MQKKYRGNMNDLREKNLKKWEEKMNRAWEEEFKQEEAKKELAVQAAKAQQEAINLLKACVNQKEDNSEKCIFEDHHIGSKKEAIETLHSVIKNEIIISNQFKLDLKEIVMKFDYSKHMERKSEAGKLNHKVWEINAHYDEIECQDTRKMISDCMEKMHGIDTQSDYESCVGITNKCYMMEGHH